MNRTAWKRLYAVWMRSYTTCGRWIDETSWFPLLAALTLFLLGATLARHGWI